MSNRTIDSLEKELDVKIPRSAVEERDGGGGRRLSYLSGHYVIDRLNKVFGHLNWAKEITDVRQVVNATGRGEFPAYLVKVRLTVIHAGQTTVKEGYGYGSDKSSQNAHELAIKEAVTDGLKVAAKDLGMSMGLALYDKEQTNVDDGPSEELKANIEHSKPAPQPKANPKPNPAKAAPVEIKNTPIGQTGEIEEAIRGYVRVADKQKRLSTDQFKAHLTDRYKVGRLAELTESQMEEVLAYLQNLTK